MIKSEQEYLEWCREQHKTFPGTIDFISYDEYFIQELEKIGNENIISAIDIVIKKHENGEL